MRLLFTLLFALGFTFSSLADGIQIYNGTSVTVVVKVGLNDGTDCVADSWFTVCIAPGATYSQAISDTPFKVRVFEDLGSCIPDYTSESWQHNATWTACPPGSPDINPFSMTWFHAHPTSWGINISET
ncbi:MAG: hypothetical protein GQ574_04760 [Crocinitomix sp.]|nr:hypothetical protein [Crocinitomix sp.]